MRRRSTLLLWVFVCLWNTLAAQLDQSACIQNAVIIERSGQSPIYVCKGDGVEDVLRFRVSPFAQPFAYLVTDENNRIVLVSRNNNIDFESLPKGNLRVWAFAFKGDITAKVGDIATTAQLATYCYALTTNFIPIYGVVPDGGTIATKDGRSSLFTCAGDSAADQISFSTTSTDPLYRYVITDENNTILGFADGDTFDFEKLTVGKARVWGVSYVGNVLAKIGDNIKTVNFSSRCFDLSDNFVEVTRAKPEGGTVSLSNGETTKTLCAQQLQNDVLTFINRNSAPTAYAFLVTDDNGKVLEVLTGNTATLRVSSPGICRVYGVSYTGNLKVKVGDNINTTALSDDCYDLSSNFVRLIKREVDGGTVKLASGGTSAVVCVTQGTSNAVTFASTGSSSSSSYAYLITDENNTIVAISNGSTFDFTNVSGRGFRVWGLSYSGTLLAKIGDNAATAALANECYDLSDNFITISRQSVNGAGISLQSGATNGIACTGDGRADIFAFKNTSTSVESYIYLITDIRGVVIGFINGNQFDFNNLNVDVARVYGLSYSGEFRVKVGDNINTGNLSSNCFDLSDNFVTITRTFVDGGSVSVAGGGTAAQVCLGSASGGTLSFANTSTATVSYGYLITDNANVILAIATTGSFNFSNLTGSAFRVWGFSYSNNITAKVGDNAATVPLSNGCYELSSNFITVTTDAVDAGAVSLAGGATSGFSCLGDANTQSFTFSNNSTAENDTYAYIITNESNIVIAINNTNTFNLEQLASGTYRVYGISYTGTLTLAVGANVTTAVISNKCYAVSNNFITLTQSTVDGGTVRLASDSTSRIVCSNADSTTLSFKNTATATGSYGYLITDTSNVIIAIATGNTYNFVGNTTRTFRVWGFSYNGNITAKVGDNAASAALTNACYELSSNFVTVTRKQVEGAKVSLANGDTARVACIGVAQLGDLTFKNSSTAGANYAYLVTNPQNIVLAVVSGTSYNFNSQPIGTYRVWGVSYTGTLTVTAGNNVGQFLSSECYDLSDNFITITQKGVNGGFVSLTNGDTTVAVCGNTSTPGALNLKFTTNANASYVFLVVDRNNRIVVILEGPAISFNGAAIGEYRIYGLSYTGTLLAKIGDTINTVVFTNECYDLSDNFVRIIRQATDGGVIATNSDTSRTVCPGNGKADVFTFSTTGNSSGRYVYILTDNTNRYISTLNNNSINFDTIPEGTYRVWGLAFTGNLTLRPGDNAAQIALSSQCYDLSENFIRIVSQIPAGGKVALPEGEVRHFTCPADNQADSLTFSASGQKGAKYVFLVTDSSNVIEAIVTSGVYNFEKPTQGVNRVWGLAYNGNLTAKVGDNAATATLSDDCFDLSDNFIEVIRETPVGGDVFLQNRDTSVVVCANTGASQVLRFDSTGTSRGEYIYVITDTNNVIRNGITGDEFDFSFLQPAGTYRVWGLAYTGTLIATIGDTINRVAISDDCYTLSANFVTVTISNPDGGAITANGSANAIAICAGDGVPNVVQFANNSSATAKYVYIITDNRNVLLSTLTGNSFDFENINVDSVRVWGLSYLGDLRLQVGQDADSVALSSGCYDLSSNFITITKSNVNGAAIASNRGAGVIYTCANDGVADSTLFSNTSDASGAQYRYILTNESNIIRGVITGNQFNFETAGRGVSRVWGVSFTGTLSATFGANITTARLSNGCYDLSNNFITVSRDSVLGGDIATASGETNVLFCPSPNVPGIVFSTTSELFSGYAFVVTDTFNTVIKINNSDTVRFDSLAVGNYRVWGLSYTGNILVKPGDNILGVDLASSCYEISSGFVRVYRSKQIDGGRIVNTNGAAVLNVCASDTIADLVVINNNSESREAAYRYILTDQNNRVIFRMVENVIDFNRAARGTYRIWGVSYSGEFLALANDNATTAVLSDSCYQLSENFITINVITPNAGRVTTADSLTAISVTLGDTLPHIEHFIAQNVAGGNRYNFLLTDSLNRLLAISMGDSINLGPLTAGNYRVWGLAYDGDFTGAIGDTITNANLSTGCFDLSSNFVQVTLSSSFAGGNESARLEEAVTKIPLQVQLSPNPVVDKLRVTFTLGEAANATTNVLIYNAMGQPIYETRIGTNVGENQHSLNLENLPDGMYILQVRNGKEVQSVRFLRQWQ